LTVNVKATIPIDESPETWYNAKWNFGGDLSRLGKGEIHANLVHLSGLLFLHFAPFPYASMTHQLEGLKLAERGRIPRRQMVLLMTGLAALAIPFTFGLYLILWYQYGANILAGGSTQGAYNVTIAVDEYNLVAALLQEGHRPPDGPRNGFTLGALGMTVMWCLLRMRFLRFPLHPLAYVLGTPYAYAYWGPFLTAWVLKVIIFRLGGVRLYRRLIPAFIGLILGQIFTMSVLHQVLTLFLGEDWGKAAFPGMYL